MFARALHQQELEASQSSSSAHPSTQDDAAQARALQAQYNSGQPSPTTIAPPPPPSHSPPPSTNQPIPSAHTNQPILALSTQAPQQPDYNADLQQLDFSSGRPPPVIQPQQADAEDEQYRAMLQQACEESLRHEMQDRSNQSPEDQAQLDAAIRASIEEEERYNQRLRDQEIREQNDLELAMHRSVGKGRASHAIYTPILQPSP